MKAAVTAEGPDLDSRVDPRFGRCAYFVFVEIEDLSFEGVENPNVALGGGAGIQSAQLVSEKGAGVVITGNVGPNAYRTLEAARLQVVTGASGTVRQAVDAFKSGALSAAQGATVESRFGMGAAGQGIDVWGGMGRGMGRGGGGGMGGGGGGRGMGRGMGGGRGMGRGMGGGRGMGRGMGQGMGMGVPVGPGMAPGAAVPGAPPGPAQEIDVLRNQAQAMAAQLEAMNARIAQLEQGAGASLVAAVDAKLCDACGRCAEVCPAGAITVEDVARIDGARCNGCARCVAACSRGAVSLHRA
jgi:predicted Fe-Mo cluster-binding NifX family protein/ferredoxin